VFTQGSAEVRIQGVYVLYLAAYAPTRRDDPFGTESGFRENGNLMEGCVALGVNPESPIERVNWERARARSALVTAGARNVDRLFARKRTGTKWRIRLQLEPGRIEVDVA
jgi:hypothetical protein